MRAAAFLLALLMPMTLHASLFLSNAIGQDLGAIEALTGEGYEGEREEGRTTIYHDGNPIMTITETETLLERIEDGYEESIVFDQDMRRIRESVNDQGHITERVYSYDGDRLSSVTITGDDGIESIIEYIDTPQGRLMGLSGSISGYMGPSYYIYSRDGSSITSSFHSSERDTSSFIPDPAIYTIDEEGRWIGTRDGVTRIYTPDGHLLSLSSEGRSESYSYNEEGEMITSVIEEADTRTERDYADGRMVAERSFSQNIISREREYREDGTVRETRYSGGARRSIIVFDSDGLRVLSVENFR